MLQVSAIILDIECKKFPIILTVFWKQKKYLIFATKSCKYKINVHNITPND